MEITMEFKDLLNEYIQQLNCTAKTLSEASGLSASTISRYRSGDRIPDPGSDNYLALIRGIAKLASESEQNVVDNLSEDQIALEFSRLLETDSVDFNRLQTNLNTLLQLLSVNHSELSRFLNYDPSYISRIRNGQRQPSRPMEFASGVANFVARHYQSPSEKLVLSRLINCSVSDLEQPSVCADLLTEWLISESADYKNELTKFLEKLDEFDLNEYIRAIHFDELKVPSVPFQLPTSRSYFGLQEMMDSELSFLKATVLSKSMEPVTMYSDMPMEEMAKDPDFPKKWMFGMAMMLKKGLHLNQIHNIDRSFEEMMLGLESWIPMYMTGQISPYYLKGTHHQVFHHFLKVSGSAALIGEAINGFHSDGKYYLTKNKEEVAYYQRQAKHLLERAYPLMEIFRQDQATAFHAFLQSDSKTGGIRSSILSALPLYTATEDLLLKILTENKVAKKDQETILAYYRLSRERVEDILSHDYIFESIPVLTEDDFQKMPMFLSLSGMFCETDLPYSFETYQEHLEQMRRFEAAHPTYKIHEDHAPAFRNIQILMHEKKWVIVSKNKAPAIHFVIRHPKMREAFEHMVIPIIENDVL